MRFEAILYFYYWYFVSSRNQIGVLHSKWIPMFVTVLCVTQNEEHPDHTVSLLYLPANCSAVNISLLECHQRQQHEMLGPVIKSDNLGNQSIAHTDDDNNPSGWMAETKKNKTKRNQITAKNVPQGTPTKKRKVKSK